MKQLDPRLVLAAGGWDPRYAVTLAVATNGKVGAALIDSNGDEADIDLDYYALDADGNWCEGYSTVAGGAGTSVSTEMTAIWGRTDPNAIVDLEYLVGHRHSVVASAFGWWLFVAPSTADSGAMPRCIGSRR